MSKMRPKLRGDWVPLFVTKIHGYIDGKIGAVALDADGGHGQFLECEEANYKAFVRKLFMTLEENTSKLHRKSAELCVEYADIKEKLEQPDEQPKGATASIVTRDAIRIARVKPQLRNRCLEIKLNLSAIHADLGKAVNESVNCQREAFSHTERRIHAYLLGASFAMRKAQGLARYELTEDPDAEKDYLNRHAWSDSIRQQLLDSVLQEVNDDVA